MHSRKLNPTQLVCNFQSSCDDLQLHTEADIDYTTAEDESKFIQSSSPTVGNKIKFLI